MFPIVSSKCDLQRLQLMSTTWTLWTAQWCRMVRWRQILWIGHGLSSDEPLVQCFLGRLLTAELLKHSLVASPELNCEHWSSYSASAYAASASAAAFATLNHPSETSSLESLSCLVCFRFALRLSWCLPRMCGVDLEWQDSKAGKEYLGQERKHLFFFFFSPPQIWDKITCCPPDTSESPTPAMS